MTKSRFFSQSELSKHFPTCHFAGKCQIDKKAKLENCVLTDCMIGQGVALSGLEIQGGQIEVFKPKKLEKNIFDKKYFNYLLNFDKCLFDDVEILLICPNPEISEFCKKLFTKLHATIQIESEDLFNGAKMPQVIAARMAAKHGADIGFVLSANAEQLFAVNHTYSTINGDEILFLLAWWWKNIKTEPLDRVGGTWQTNLGIENKLRALGADLVRAKQGESFAEVSKKNGLKIGASQDGHMWADFGMHPEDCVLVMRVLASVFLQNKNIWQRVKENRYTQILKTVEIGTGVKISKADIKAFVDFYMLKMKKTGRIFVWKEKNVLNILVEGLEKNAAIIVANDIRKKIIKYLKN